MADPALIAMDESTSGKYVTVGGVFLNASDIDAVLVSLTDLKRRYNLPVDVEIHCRELFAFHKRIKSPFKVIAPDELISFLEDCVRSTTSFGASWYLIHCDRTKYPKNFTMFEGNRSFEVSEKHIAAYMVGMFASMIETVKGSDFQYIFDKDASQVDFGVRRMQATGFASQSARAIVPTPKLKPLLELADVVAYVCGRALTAKDEPGNRKVARFLPLARTINAHSWTFAWPSDVSLEQ